MKKYWLLCAFFLLSTFNLYADKKVIVVGASAGIGREVARVFCSKGYQVGGISRNGVALKALQAELGKNFTFKLGDVRNEACSDTVKQLISEMGGCDIFVMNAGTWADIRREVTTESVVSYDWEELLNDQISTIETNIVGFTRMAAVAIEYFIQQKKGHFVGVSSVDGVRGTPTCPVYSGSKSFQSTYMQSMRSLFTQTGFDISVTDIRPGFVATEEIQEGEFWVEALDKAAKDIVDAIIKKKKVAYIRARWALFAAYVSLAPDILYDFVSQKFGIRSPDAFVHEDGIEA